VGGAEVAEDAVVGSCGSWDTHPGSDPPLSPLPGGAPWPTFSHPWSGRISLWPHQGQGGSFPAPAGGHGHECFLLRADLDSTSAQLVVAGGWLSFFHHGW
jgi:hypothetical protein